MCLGETCDYYVSKHVCSAIIVADNFKNPEDAFQKLCPCDIEKSPRHKAKGKMM